MREICVQENRALPPRCVPGEVRRIMLIHPHRLARCIKKYHMPVQDDVIEIEGRITAVLAGTMFRVELANKHLVLAHISGRMRKSFIRLAMGDRVKLEMSPYDLSKARIVYRLQG